MALIPDTLLEGVLAVAGGATLIVFAAGLSNFFIQPATLTRPQRLFQDFKIVLGLIHFLARIHTTLRAVPLLAILAGAGTS